MCYKIYRSICDLKGISGTNLLKINIVWSQNVCVLIYAYDKILT